MVPLGENWQLALSGKEPQLMLTGPVNVSVESVTVVELLTFPCTAETLVGFGVLSATSVAFKLTACVR